MIHFPSLKHGDKIALACPGSRCLNEAEVIAAKAYLEGRGFQVVYGAECYDYLPPEERAHIFAEYLFDEQVKMIWVLRGGEGSADLLPFLEQHRRVFQKLQPKLLFGFSDFTVLLNYFAFQYGWPVVHGMGAVQLVKDLLDQRSKDLSLSLVLGEESYSIDGLRALNDAASSFSEIHAVCCGGNLSLLNIAIGDVWQFDAADKIVIIEDVNEKAYQIIRALKYLQRISFFKRVKALIFGDFNANAIGTTIAEQQKEAKNILRYLGYFAESVDFPVLLTEKIGHGSVNYPVIFNVPAVLSSNFTLQFSMVCI